MANKYDMRTAHGRLQASADKTNATMEVVHTETKLATFVIKQYRDHSQGGKPMEALYLKDMDGMEIRIQQTRVLGSLQKVLDAIT